MHQLRAMGIAKFKDQRRYTVMGPVMASIALLAQVHDKIFPGRAYVSHWWCFPQDLDMWRAEKDSEPNW